MKYSLEKNVLIKTVLPKAGIVSSNPQRVERIKSNLDNLEKHTDTWGIVIYTGSYFNKPMFVSSVPMGSAGSGFAFIEMYAAGVDYIVRYGSNDKSVTEKNLTDILIVDEANNLNGVMHDGGFDQETFGKTYFASPILVKVLEEESRALNLNTQKFICHNTDDYHAFNYPELFCNNEKAIKDVIQKIEGLNTEKRHCWDMETAALFHRASQFDKHAITVLQNLIKHNISAQPYETHYKTVLFDMEKQFTQLVFGALSKLI